jgi:hypothetical protein
MIVNQVEAVCDRLPLIADAYPTNRSLRLLKNFRRFTILRTLSNSSLYQLIFRLVKRV